MFDSSSDTLKKSWLYIFDSNQQHNIYTSNYLIE